MRNTFLSPFSTPMLKVGVYPSSKHFTSYTKTESVGRVCWLNGKCGDYNGENEIMPDKKKFAGVSPVCCFLGSVGKR